MYRSRTVRELMRMHAHELQRRDEMIQQLLDRLQHPDRVPIWREPPQADPPENRMYLVPDPDQLPT